MVYGKQPKAAKKGAKGVIHISLGRSTAQPQEHTQNIFRKRQRREVIDKPQGL
jgi:hypothetical protein